MSVDDERIQISYGKLRVPVHRTYARPLSGFAAIPESTFTGDANHLLALEIDVEVFGQTFLPAYTEGDNRNVVATDTMKNFILRQAVLFDGATPEAFLAFLGKQFLTQYQTMEALQLTARELLFEAVDLPPNAIQEDDPILFRRRSGDYAFCTLRMGRDPLGEGFQMASLESGIAGIELLKITGSSFAGYRQDEYTTLPQTEDRPLFVRMDLTWTYERPQDGTSNDLSRYLPAQQVRDFVSTTFHGFVSHSIQELVYVMGNRMFERFPQISSLSFAAENHTHDLIAEDPDDPRIKVYTAPFVANGLITLTLRR
ncbi:MAG: urate oxidase [Firmicutes bacterium]|nr:urate oxidase [Bacillota bacterium]